MRSSLPLSVFGTTALPHAHPKAEARVYGLSTSIDLARGGVEVSSAEELIKCWALLEEFGHLRGTYETERFLLRVLSTGPEIAGQFKGLFNDHRAVEFANKVIEDEDVWSMHGPSRGYR